MHLMLHNIYVKWLVILLVSRFLLSLLFALLNVHSAALLAGDCPGNPLGDGETLILIASVANLSAGLSRHPVHHVAALLPGHEIALLLVNIPRPGHGLALANLVGNLLALLTRLLDVIADLSGNLGALLLVGAH